MATQKPTTKNSTVINELDQTALIAHHYGFTPITGPKITPEDKAHAKQLYSPVAHHGETEDRVACVRMYQNMEFGILTQPPMLYFKKPLPGSDIKKKPTVDMVGLEILNVSRAAAEALVIRTAYATLEDAGCENIRVEINSIGDKESFSRFERELHTYLRKNVQTLSATARQKIKEDNLALFYTDNKDKEWVTLRDEAPKPMSSLSEPSRIHFKEVLEFLESSGIAYQIQMNLLPNTAYASHTVFEIRGSATKGAPETLLTYGGRYNYLAKKTGGKKDIACCGATILCPKKAVTKKSVAHKVKPSRFYLVQLGNLAKLQTLNIIELLRNENITVYHSLTKENIGSQMASAEHLKVSHLLIVGQKEAIERSVVVRSTDVRVQETVKMEELCGYLKKIVKESK